MGKNEINLADNLINIINTARENALKKVNEELINMYWQVGEYLHKESQKSMFGDSYIDSIAKEIQEEFPGIKGFNRRGLYRMKQFYETYAENDVVTPLVTQISWTNHLLIMSGCKSDEEREFYIRLCIKEKYSKRQLQRQLDSGYYERYSFVYLYEDIFNALSALKYESGENYGSILVLCRTKDKSFDEVQSNYKISIKFKHEIELENNSYKKIRKLLEMAKKNMSLLMNEDGKIYAMGKMIDNPSCEYYEISFDGFFKWTLYKNKEKLLCYENMIPMIPDKEIGISNKNLELLKRTFDISDTSKFEKIIQKAVSQKHGTIVVFAENAMDEASRLEESGISITPIDISTGMLVEEITSIDGALICDVDGICYSIGTILDGIKSERTDSSRGARYNSAIRYIEKQKKNQKKTFIVVVSEDGYVNCFSSEE